MAWAGSEQWNEYYEAARARRRVRGRDPLDGLIKRQAVREKVFWAGSLVFVAGLVFGFYELLIR
jgi:hypothetical protein